jgi:hypothetical protein
LECRPSNREHWTDRAVNESLHWAEARLGEQTIMNRTIWVGAVAYDPKVVTIWEGMRRYFHDEAHLPVEVVLFQSYEAQVTALLAEYAFACTMISLWEGAHA